MRATSYSLWKMEKFARLIPLTLNGQKRGISTTSSLAGKRNFRKFLVYNKRGTRVVKEAQQALGRNAPVPIHTRGVRDIGYYDFKNKFITIPERIPELIVPDLTDCKLRPYVSYRAPDVTQDEYTSLDLFNAIYSKKIVEDFKEGKLNADGAAMEPSENEKLTADEALLRARKTGTDIF